MAKNAIVGQSGGPTSVINASLAGVYESCKRRGAGKVYGMLHGVAGLLEKWPELPVYIHRADAVDGAGGELRFPRLGEKNQRYYQEGDKLTLGGLTLDVLETPGHSQGSVCLLVEGQRVIFSGDTLFRGNCGRCDFPGGDYRAMLRSLGRLGKLEGQYTVYPGHDEATDMDYERKYNPYMKQGMNA